MAKFDGFWLEKHPKPEDFRCNLDAKPKLVLSRARRAARPSEKPVLMIRATSSRSTRPNHMSNQIDNPKAPRLASLRRFAGDLHSVTKQTPLRVTFRVHFGGQKPPKIDEISSF